MDATIQSVGHNEPESQKLPENTAIEPTQSIEEPVKQDTTE
jgi:hypothetical protein